MIVKLLTEHHLEFLSLKGGCRGLSESTHVKMPHCWKSHATAQYRSCYIHLTGMDSGAVRIACGIEVDGEDIGHGGPNMTWKKLTVNNCREWKPSKIMFFYS